jgi:hypothetical protein
VTFESKGAGIDGQLGQGPTTKHVLEPTVVGYFRKHHLGVKEIVCGSHHNAAITSDGELYTWGSRASNCLGRREVDVEAGDGDSCWNYSSTPGHCSGFGVIVGRIGRGMVRSVACGKHFTVVATFPYQGPSEVEANRFLQEHSSKMKRLRFEHEEDVQRHTETQRNAELNEEAYERVKFLTAKRLCSIDPTCPGFQVHAEKPSLCRECGHSEAYHSIVVE